MIISEKLVLLFGNFFGTKVKQFKQGQQQVFAQLQSCRLAEKKNIWIHVSSLGEYEQALPVLEQLKERHPQYHIVLSFFSPSGYEIKKDKTPADCVIYLPVDTPKNAQKLLDIIRPKLVFFVKYDFWPNYLFELKKRQIPTFLVSGLFTDKHSFFKPRNAWLKKSLYAFTHFFVQDKESAESLKKQGFENSSITGDTRFDRVFQIAKNNEELDFVNRFKQDKLLFIAGSTWPKDENFILPYIQQNAENMQSIIAPHQVDKDHIEQITKELNVPNILFTEIDDNTDLSKCKVLIINVIGLLNKTYKYADIVYIGNGFGKSIHNIQEPAVFVVPIITGPNIHKFNEAKDLQQLGGLVVIRQASEFGEVMNRLINDAALRSEKAEITGNYAKRNIGATQKIMMFLEQKYL